MSGAAGALADAADSGDASRLGRAASWRLRFPGPRKGRLRTGSIGSVSDAAARFVAGLSRPTVMRRALATPSDARIPPMGRANVGMPRWWRPATATGAEPLPRIEPAKLPVRGLPRAARQIPTEQNWSPGGIAESLKSSEVKVRRYAEVSAAGKLAPVPRFSAAAVQVRAASEARQRDEAAVVRRSTAAGPTGPPASQTPAPAAPPPAAPTASAVAAPPSAAATAPAPASAAPTSAVTASSTSPLNAVPTVSDAAATAAPSAPSAPPASSATAGTPEAAAPAVPGGPTWRPTPLSSRFVAATGAAATSVTAVATCPVRRRMAGSVATAVLDRALDPYLAHVARPGHHPTPAGLRPLRRMVGTPEAIRPAARAGAVGARPSAGPIPAVASSAARATQFAAANTPGAAPTSLRRTAVAAPEAPATAANTPATSAPLPPVAATSALTSPADASPSTASAPAPQPGHPAPHTAGSSTTAVTPSATSMPASPSPVAAASPDAGSQPAIGRSAATASVGGGEVVPLHRLPVGETTGVNVPVAESPRAPRGFALASVRSLRTLTGPATDLRPATRAAGLPTNPGGHIPSMPAAVRRRAADTAPAATVVRRAVRTPAPAQPAGTTAAPAPATPSGSAPAATAAARSAAHAPATANPASTTGQIASTGRSATALVAAATSSAPALARVSAVTPGQRLAAISMTDQFAVRRRAVHGSRDAALGSGFGSAEVIRPSTVSRSAPLAPGTGGLQPIRPRVAATAVPVPASAAGPVVTSVAAPASATSRATAGREASNRTITGRPGAPPASTVRRSTALAERQASTGAAAATVPGGIAALGSAGPPPVPAVARANLAGTAFAGTAFAESGPAGAVLRRSFVVAPPPISLGPRRSTAAAAASPPAPAAAPTTPPASGGRSSIYTAAAELFRTFGGTSAAQRGGDMTDSSSDGAQVIRRFRPPALAPGGSQAGEDVHRPVASWSADGNRPTVAPAGTVLDSRQLDDLVDQVVDRIEQRVIDELERRGRFGIVGGM